MIDICEYENKRTHAKLARNAINNYQNSLCALQKKYLNDFGQQKLDVALPFTSIEISRTIFYIDKN